MGQRRGLQGIDSTFHSTRNQLDPLYMIMIIPEYKSCMITSYGVHGNRIRYHALIMQAANLPDPHAKVLDHERVQAVIMTGMK